MKRQKRDKLQRAHTKGFNAALQGQSKENCPFEELNAREEWLGGWREGREAFTTNGMKAYI
ncbi:MAG: ribosome modulation factor [Kangiella sp.]|jgi:ribosome modulation factor|uniref:Ribosome modulation factor n=3 Tax=Kangiella TaxID=261963 RepID=RMF_KANKD|nr:MULTISPECIES: ribosome modulation factor [Kangiella]C7RB40.1 RecName: Full=Ribosome modulation factor; Short=RMF [Kangiella koreensis DSM 16069]ACV26482.1 ribosome modulation factor [Kangiella koreensis DSM 16069]AUD78654.1 ribosome modulation factor [Kangiella profundi]MBD3653585.1 ribosome modulation factor [Kangiella sp.]MBD3667134.1 ribosome modulation factor [Kangiella sp.]MCW8857520.1 ribosome modulation factor [Kangiella sp.]